jgi:undecaprenyl-phosphate galactose phosphotransferase
VIFFQEIHPKKCHNNFLGRGVQKRTSAHCPKKEEMQAYALLRQFRTAYSPAGMARALLVAATLFVADFLALGLAFYAALDVRALAKLAGTPPVLSLWMQTPAASHLIGFVCASALVIVWFGIDGHYSKRVPFWEELGRILSILLTGLITEVALLMLLSHARTPWMLLTVTWVGVFALVPLGRFGARTLVLGCGLSRRDTIIVGLGENARAAYMALRGEPLMGYEVKWFGRCRGDNAVSDGAMHVEGFRVPIVDLSQQPIAALQDLGNPKIVIAVDGLAGQEDLVLELGAASRDLMVIPSIRGLPLQGAEVSHFFSRELLMLRLKNNLAHRGARFVKRVFDIVGSASLLVLLAPLLLGIAYLIRRDGGDAIYRHMRIGTGGREFGCLKFRSMVVDADRVLQELFACDPRALTEWEKDFKLKRDPRITPIGAFLRCSSLDELPQLINVLKGEMSLVGPRPVVREELARYGDRVAYYLQVRPGITGLWQTSGRNDVDYAKRVSLDVWYVKNWSLWTDIVILLKTCRAVTWRMGAY